MKQLVIVLIIISFFFIPLHARAKTKKKATTQEIIIPFEELFGLDEKSIKRREEKDSQTWLWWPYYHKGNALGMLGRFDDAITVFNQSLILNKSLKVYFSRGKAYQGNKLFKNALADYNTVIEINSNMLMAWTHKGFIHLMLDAEESGKGHDKQACIAFNKACKLGDCRLLNEFDHCNK